MSREAEVNPLSSIPARSSRHRLAQLTHKQHALINTTTNPADSGSYRLLRSFVKAGAAEVSAVEGRVKRARRKAENEIHEVISL